MKSKTSTEKNKSIQEKDVTELRGPNRFYRDERLDARDFEGIDVTLFVTDHEGKRMTGSLGNISTTGMKAFFEPGHNFGLGDETTLGFRADNYQIYHGRCVVRRVQNEKGKLAVAFEFMDSLVDIQTIKSVALKELKQLKPAVATLLHSREQVKLKEDTPETREFKVLLAEFRAFLYETRNILNQVEKETGILTPEDDGFNEVLQKIGEQNPQTPFGREVNRSTDAKQGAVNRAVDKWKSSAAYKKEHQK
jgi:hypothetical protein